MEDKKLMNSKVWIFFDWVWRLMVLNILMLISSIGIITIMPAICAGFKSIKDTKENYSPNIIKNYFEYHFHNEKNFTYDINLKKNKITATGYINGKPIARATDDNQNRAKAKLFLTVLKDLICL